MDVIDILIYVRVEDIPIINNLFSSMSESADGNSKLGMLVGMKFSWQ